MIDDSQLVSTLLEHQLLDRATIERGRGIQRQEGGSLFEVLVDHSLVEEQRVVDALAALYNVASASLKGVEFNPDVIALVPQELAMETRCLPLEIWADDPSFPELLLAMEDPLDMMAMDDVATHTGIDIRPVLVGPRDLTAALMRAYSASPYPAAPALPPLADDAVSANAVSADDIFAGAFDSDADSDEDGDEDGDFFSGEPSIQLLGDDGMNLHASALPPIQQSRDPFFSDSSSLSPFPSSASEEPEEEDEPPLFKEFEEDVPEVFGSKAGVPEDLDAFFADFDDISDLEDVSNLDDVSQLKDEEDDLPLFSDSPPAATPLPELLAKEPAAQEEPKEEEPVVEAAPEEEPEEDKLKGLLSKLRPNNKSPLSSSSGLSSLSSKLGSKPKLSTANRLSRLPSSPKAKPEPQKSAPAEPDEGGSPFPGTTPHSLAEIRLDDVVPPSKTKPKRDEDAGPFPGTTAESVEIRLTDFVAEIDEQEGNSTQFVGRPTASPDAPVDGNRTYLSFVPQHEVNPSPGLAESTSHEPDFDANAYFGDEKLPVNPDLSYFQSVENDDGWFSVKAPTDPRVQAPPKVAAIGRIKPKRMMRGANGELIEAPEADEEQSNEEASAQSVEAEEAEQATIAVDPDEIEVGNLMRGFNRRDAAVEANMRKTRPKTPSLAEPQTREVALPEDSDFDVEEFLSEQADPPTPPPPHIEEDTRHSRETMQAFALTPEQAKAFADARKKGIESTGLEADSEMNTPLPPDLEQLEFPADLDDAELMRAALRLLIAKGFIGFDELIAEARRAQSKKEYN